MVQKIILQLQDGMFNGSQILGKNDLITTIAGIRKKFQQ